MSDKEGYLVARSIDYGNYHGSQSWEGPFDCSTGEHCNPPGDHLHCDGPRKGDRLRFRRHGDDSDRVGIVAFHWHYEGCMIDVEVDGVRVTPAVCPALGDRAEVVAPVDRASKGDRDG